MKSDREDAVKLECFDALTAAFAAFPKTCDSGLTRALVEKARDLAIVRAQQECALEKAKKTSQSAIAAATKRKIASLKLLGKIGRANRRLAFVEASEISRSRLADAIAGAAMTTFTDSGASSRKGFLRKPATRSRRFCIRSAPRAYHRRARFNKRRCSRIGSANCVRKKRYR